MDEVDEALVKVYNWRMSKFIVLSSILYQEHHLLLNMLNQNGHIYSIICIGGQGSVKKKTGKKVELGYVIDVHTLSENQKYQHSYLKEFELIWNPWKTRHNYSAWSLLNFMLEVSLRILPSKELSVQEWSNLKQDPNLSKEYEVLVKLLFFLEEISNDSFDKKDAKYLCLFFLAKMMILQGVFPRISQCYHCGSQLTKNNIALFQTSHFYCLNCQSVHVRAREFWAFLNFAKNTKYEELRQLPKQAWQLVEQTSIADYMEQFFTMLNLSKSNLRTYSSIF